MDRKLIDKNYGKFQFKIFENPTSKVEPEDNNDLVINAELIGEDP